MCCYLHVEGGVGGEMWEVFEKRQLCAEAAQISPTTGGANGVMRCCVLAAVSEAPMQHQAAC